MDVDKVWDANPKGCENCRRGYKGRIAFHEVLELDDSIRDALNNENLENAPPEIKSIKPLNPPLTSVITSSNTTKLTPGTVIKHPSLNITISNNVYKTIIIICRTCFYRNIKRFIIILCLGKWIITISKIIS